MWISFIVISIVGTLLHFLYEMSGHNKIAAIFAAVNESTWEHIKIALTPSFIWGLFDGFKFGMNENYFIAKTASLLVIVILIPLIFYTYTFITKKVVLWFDIIYFYITIFCSQYLFNYIINMNSLGFIYQYIAVVLLFVLFGTYMVATLMPLKRPIFKDPISKKYGIDGHTEMHKH